MYLKWRSGTEYISQEQICGVELVLWSKKVWASLEFKMTAQELKAENARLSPWLLRGFLSQTSINCHFISTLCAFAFAYICMPVCPCVSKNAVCNSGLRPVPVAQPRFVRSVAFKLNFCQLFLLQLGCSAFTGELFVSPQIKGSANQDRYILRRFNGDIGKDGCAVEANSTDELLRSMNCDLCPLFPFSSLLTNCVLIDCVGKERRPLWPVINLQTYTSFVKKKKQNYCCYHALFMFISFSYH